MNYKDYIKSEIIGIQARIQTYENMLIDIKWKDLYLDSTMAILERSKEELSVLEDILERLEAYDVLLKCVRVRNVSYDENDSSMTAADYCFELDELNEEEYKKIDTQFKKYLESVNE